MKSTYIWSAYPSPNMCAIRFEAIIQYVPKTKPESINSKGSVSDWGFMFLQHLTHKVPILSCDSAPSLLHYSASPIGHDTDPLTHLIMFTCEIYPKIVI